jgi:thioredoxin-related protein
VLLDPELSIPPNNAIRVLFRISLFLLVCSITGLSQKAQPADHNLPKYDLQTETKTTGVVDEINVLTFGTRKDFTELIIKSGDDKVHIYLCPKPYEVEMGISFSKGDEVAVTGSKVKQESSDVILARQLVKGTDTLLFRDDKGKPVWDWRTGK